MQQNSEEDPFFFFWSSATYGKKSAAELPQVPGLRAR